MIKLKSIFAVSVLAMLVVVDAHADIASKGYVDEQVSNVTIVVDAALSSSSTNPVQNKVINSALAAKQNANTAVTHTANTAVGDSTHPVYVDDSGAAVKIDKVAAALNADSATKAIQDGNGANIASTYAKKTELPTKISDLTNDSDFATTTQLSAVEDKADAATTAAQTANNAIAAMDVSTSTGTGNVVTSVTQTNGKITVTKGTTLHAVATSGSYNDLANKPTIPTKTSQLTNDSNFVTADQLPDDYTLPVATDSVLGGVKSGGDITVSSTGAVTVNSATTATSATKATQDGSGRNIASTYVVKAQGSTAASKAVVTDASGNITTGTIASGMIASGAVTSAKLGDDAVTAAKIASGAVGSDALASGAVTTTKIADGTIVDADINANAAISASKIAGLADVATSGSYDDLTDAPTIPTVNNATLTIQKNGTNVATFTANSATAATANITVPTKTSELTNDSNFATTAQVNARVATAQGTANANDVMVVNSAGNVVPALITNANVSSSAAIAQSKIAGLTDALDGKLSTTGTAARATADASGNNIVNTYATKAQITALDSSTTGTGAVVTDVSQTDGKVSVTMGNVQIPVGSESATTYAKIWVE